MNTLVNNVQATKIWFDESNTWVALKDGRTLAVPLVYFPRLLYASNKQRNNVEFSGGGIGLHWDEIDEDISVEGLLLGIGDRTRKQKEATVI